MEWNYLEHDTEKLFIGFDDNTVRIRFTKVGWRELERVSDASDGMGA